MLFPLGVKELCSKGVKDVKDVKDVSLFIHSPPLGEVGRGLWGGWEGASGRGLPGSWAVCGYS